MQNDFKVIDQYISASKAIKQADRMLVSDQKVPQSVYQMDHDIYAVTHHEEYNMPTILGLSEFSTLEPVPQTTVSEINNDQRVYESESPKSFVDLDGHGISFYEESQRQIKIEKDMDHASFSCTMQDMDTAYPFYQQHIKEEEEDIGLSVIRHLKEEISNTCTILRISPDPTQWSNEDVRRWFVWYSQQYQVSSSIYEHFPMNGMQLCQLTNADFIERCHEAGPNFYDQLDVWKSARSLNDVNNETSPPQPQVTCHDWYPDYCDNNYNVTYMPSSVSPAPSDDSVDSSSNSSNTSFIPKSCHDDDYVPYSRSTSLRSPVENENRQTIHLWQFLKDLLLRPDRYNSCIKWVDRQRGIFKIEDSSKVAKLWGLRKNRPAMNYDKLSRSIRQYYKKGIIKKTEHSKRLVYQFCQPYL